MPVVGNLTNLSLTCEHGSRVHFSHTPPMTFARSPAPCSRAHNLKYFLALRSVPIRMFHTRAISVVADHRLTKTLGVGEVIERDEILAVVLLVSECFASHAYRLPLKDVAHRAALTKAAILPMLVSRARHTQCGL